MTVSLPGRLTRTLEWTLLLLASTFLVLHTLPNAWRSLNTDFPNYLLTAHLAQQGFDTSQAYDWRWLQREKDHLQIDQRIIGLAPITPFSTLFVWPLAHLAHLPAKHLWLLLQLALLIPIGLMLRSLTGQPIRRIALLAALCLPLHRNLLYGQFYILLLAMLVAACWAFRRQHSGLSGTLIGLAAMTKIFPIVFVLYFLRKRDGRALLACAVTLLACTALSISVFGWQMHRHYLQVVLPWTLRGETLPPYILSSSSLSTLLHRLFLLEPQWNPHPWHNAPLCAALLAPTLQAILLAPALLLITPGPDTDRSTAPIEWSTLLCATLATSTVPASYNFTLLLLPIVVLLSGRTGRTGTTLLAVALFLGIGYPGWNTSPADGLQALLHVPRLYLLLAFTLLCLARLAGPTLRRRLLHPANLSWSIAIALVTLTGIATGIARQRTLQQDYPFRLAMPAEALFSASPQFTHHGVQQISLVPTGYRLTASTPSANLPDQLTFAVSPDASHQWVEEVNPASRLVSTGDSAPVEDAHSPILSADGHLLAYLRDHQGRAQLFDTSSAIPVTPANMNVFEASRLHDGSYLVAAALDGASPQLFHTHPNATPTPMNLGETRFPSVSPDGQWLAYSRMHSGAWNLWLLHLTDHTTHRLTHAPCNQVEPSWEPDSRTLLYASDCGRALGFTAICRRKVLQ
jgi:hypothetical protein